MEDTELALRLLRLYRSLERQPSTPQSTNTPGRNDTPVGTSPVPRLDVDDGRRLSFLEALGPDDEPPANTHMQLLSAFYEESAPDGKAWLMSYLSDHFLGHASPDKRSELFALILRSLPVDSRVMRLAQQHEWYLRNMGRPQ
jgi:hypothetical protein